MAAKQPTPTEAMAVLQIVAVKKYNNGSITKAKFDRALKALRDFQVATGTGQGAKRRRR